MYFQLAFAIDRVQARSRPRIPSGPPRSRSRPRWRATSKALAASGERGLASMLVMATHAGTTTDEFAQIVQRLGEDGAASDARAPLRGAHLPADARAARLPARQRLQDVHRLGRRRRVPARDGARSSTASRPSRSIGSSIRTKYEVRDGRAGDRAAAGDRLHRRQGRQAGRHPQVHRPAPDRRVRQLGWRLRDARVRHVRPRRAPRRARASRRRGEREFAYDRDSHVGRLARGLDEAGRRGWLVVGMQRDWRRVYGFDR